jgi:hypothetical protein
MKWITRERPKIDRIACPWLIQKFIDKGADFLFVPKDQVLAVAKETGAIPFDIPGVELTHDGEFCSFDAFIKKYNLKDPALERLSVIIRGADTDRNDLAPECSGLLAITLGLAASYTNDHELIKQGFVVYDALYLWAQSLTEERHGWYV